MRTVIWFSCGAASATAAYLTLKKYPDAILVYCDTGGEHPDNKRFLADVEKWLNKKGIILKSEKYAVHFAVIEKTRYVNGPKGARCTAELKKLLRLKFQEVDDLQVYGYTADKKDADRAKRFNETFPEVSTWFPLIDKHMRKQDCLGLIKQVGITIPAMYLLGYQNNNCIGCVKGGQGYWNKIRKDFPDQFNCMAKLEREIGDSCIKDKFLDELDPEAGRDENISDMSCDMVCQSIL